MLAPPKGHHDLAFRLAYEQWAAGPRSQRLAPVVRVVLAELKDVLAD